MFTLGDNSNETGTAAQYADCYGATWGQFLDRTSASAGNHDYYANGAASYFAYFGKAAGPSGTGWYSYDLGGWHIVVLNAECEYVGGCGPGSPQDRWLVADLAAHPATCTLAYWHQPRFSSGAPGQATDVAYQWFWEDLYAFHADVVLNGHAHDYERFAPQTPSGKASPTGIREFVVGTGGAGQIPLGTVQPNSEVRHTRDARRPEAHAPRVVVRLAVHPGCRRRVHRRRVGDVPLIGRGAPAHREFRGYECRGWLVPMGTAPSDARTPSLSDLEGKEVNTL